MPLFHLLRLSPHAEGVVVDVLLGPGSSERLPPLILLFLSPTVGTWHLARR
jgi:hypothetical protein